MINTVRVNQAVHYLRSVAREYSTPIEALGLFTGDNADTFTHFSVPTILGFHGGQRDLLDGLFGRGGPTRTMAAVDLSARENGLGVIMKHRTTPGRKQETIEFFHRDLLVTHVRGSLAGYLPPEIRLAVYPDMDINVMKNEDLDAVLESYVRNAGRVTTIDEVPYVYLPVTLISKAYGTENSYYNSDEAVIQILAKNKTGDGRVTADMHLHYAVARKSARADQIAIMNAIGDDYFILPSSYDFLKFANSEDDFEAILNGSGHENNMTDRLEKKTARLVARLVLGMKPHENPAAREVLGYSVIETNTFEDDRKAEKEADDAAIVANRENATVQDKIRYFEIIKNMVTINQMPDYFDMSDRP